MEQTELAILPPQTRGLGRIGGIVGIFWDMLSCMLQIWVTRSAYIWAPNFYFICQFMLHLFT